MECDITVGDYIRYRFDGDVLGASNSLTGIIAMLPYIALQIVGIRYVLDPWASQLSQVSYIVYIIFTLFVALSGLRDLP